jgi:hypothetical protein
MNKVLTCSKSPSHQMFYRRMVVEGVALETRDENDQPLDVQDPKDLTLVKRITGVYCLGCGQQANIRLPF